MKNTFSNVRMFMRSHRASIIVLVIILGTWGGFAVSILSNTNKAIRANELAMQEREEQTRQLLDELEAKRAAEEKRADEERKAKEAAAKKAAEQAAKKKAAEAAQKQQASQAQTVPPAKCNTANSHNNPSSIDVVVNKKHCLVPLSFVPSDLVTVHGATLSAKAAGDFSKMFKAATAANQAFTVSSSYRSYQTQVSTYNYWVSVNGRQAADTVSARAGFSEHQTGFVIDVGVGSCTLNCFGGTSQYQWFQQNAANYGFIQRYYAGYESITGYASEKWHYRYVGPTVAKDMKARGIKTLEQYWGVEGGNYR